VDEPAGQDDERFQALARAAREAVLIHDRGVIVEVNDAFTRLLGWSRAEIIGKSGLEVFTDPSSRADIVASMRAEGAGGTSEVTLWSKDGRRLIVESASEPIVYRGRALRVVTMQDLTERKRIEAQARRAEALLRGISDATDQIVFVTDRDGGLLLANRAWRELFDPEGRAHRDADVFPASTAAAIREDDARVAELGAPVTYETELETRRGQRSFLVTKVPLAGTDGEVFAVGGIATDLTERNLEAKLFSTIARATLGATGPAYFEALVRAVADAFGADAVFVGELDRDGASVTSIAARVDGESAGPLTYELVGTPCEQVLGTHACVFTDGVQQRFPADTMLADMGVRAYCGVPIVSTDPAPRGILVALFRQPLDPALTDDVARVALELFAARAAAELDRIAAVAELERAKTELEERVSARTAELTAANQELEAFAYSVSHDLRAPVRHIAGYTELLEQSDGEELSPEGRRKLGVIRSASAKMNQLIDDLLSLARTGRARLTPAPVQLAPLVRRIAADLSPGDDVVWDIGELPTVHADANLLGVVLTNLLGNAVKYSRDRMPSRVTVRCEIRPSDWVIEVADNGVGFDMRYAEQLFGVFRRLHRDDEFEGTGIGLATVQRIVARHGGTVTAEGEVGRGARFRVTLPRQEGLE